jgi:toxin CcdB
MAQYDVFTNPSRSAADGIPYVVVIQSDLLDALATRLTLPLAELDMAVKVPAALCPIIVVKGKRLHALAHYAAPLPARRLKRPVDNVAAQASALVSAMDAVLSGL